MTQTVPLLSTEGCGLTLAELHHVLHPKGGGIGGAPCTDVQMVRLEMSALSAASGHFSSTCWFKDKPAACTFCFSDENFLQFR